jgi:hypothetical protein
MLVKDLCKKPPMNSDELEAPDADQQEQDELLYNGGVAFARYIASDRQAFLLKRMVEGISEGDFNGNELFNERRKLAYFVERGPSIVKNYKHQVVKPGATISAPEDSTGYWESLTKDADGLGHALSTLIEEAVEQVAIHGRAFIVPQFDDDEAQAADTETGEARIRVLPTRMVDRVSHTPTGSLNWIRTAKCGCEYKSPTDAAPIKRHTWTYILSDRFVEYTYDEPGEGQPQLPEDKKLAKKAERAHDFGQLPVVEIAVNKDLYLMDHLRAPILALFNEETDCRWLLRSTAYPTLVIIAAAQSLGKFVKHEMAGLHLQPGEDAKFISPSAECLNSHFTERDKLEKALDSVINSFPMAGAAMQTQNPRAAAQAKQLDQAGYKAFLQSTAAIVRAAFERMIAALQSFRDEETLDVQLLGLDNYDETPGTPTGIPGAQGDSAPRGPGMTKGQTRQTRDYGLDGMAAQVQNATQITNQGFSARN